jgi:RHS repeat-associated protein
MQTPTPAVNGTTTSFALAETPISGTLTVYLNGVCLHPGIGNDYTSSGSAITLAAPPASTDKLRVSYVQSALPSGVSSVVTQAPTPAVDGTTTTFEFTGQQGAETVTLNGVILQPYADYTVDGTTLTMASPPAASDLLLVSSYAGLTVQPSEIFVDAVNGRILGTVNPLSDVSEYGLDALGSVTSSRNASGAVVNNYRYKPYGQMLAGFTPGQTGYFLFGGGLNYEFLNRQGAEISAGMRIFSYMTANWTTRDPLALYAISFENPYTYAGANPLSNVDPTGLDPRCTCDFSTKPVEMSPANGLHGVNYNSDRGACYTQACCRFCRALNAQFASAFQACPPGLLNIAPKIMNQNDFFPPVNQFTFYGKYCSDAFSGAGAYGVDGEEVANKSQYPQPKPQVHFWVPFDYIGLYLFGEGCGVECRIRVCFHLLNLSNPEYYLKYDLKLCDEMHSNRTSASQSPYLVSNRRGTASTTCQPIRHKRRKK